MSLSMILAVLFGIGALIVYATVVRKGLPWGAPLMGVLVLGAVVSVVMPLTPIPTWLAQRSRRADQYSYVRELGERISDDVSTEGTVIIIRDLLYQQTPYDRIVDEFEDGIGKDVEIIREGGPKMPRLSTNGLNELLSEYDDDHNIEAVVSLLGLPVYREAYDLEHVKMFEQPDSPVFVAAVNSSNYDPESLRRYLEDGLLKAVALIPHPERPAEMVVGPDEVDRLPETLGD